MMWIQMLFISIALSIDAFAVGISYGIQKIKVEARAFAMIGGISVLIMSLSIKIGEIMKTYFPEDVMKIIGVAILVLLGVSFIRKSISTDKERAICDYDSSREISWLEGIAVGVAISIDTVSVAIGLSATGFCNYIIPWMAGCMQIMFLMFGCYIGSKVIFQKMESEKLCGIFSGGLLLFIAFIRAVS